MSEPVFKRDAFDANYRLGTEALWLHVNACGRAHIARAVERQQARIAALESEVERLTQDNAQMLEAMDRLRNRIQNERDMSCGGAWIGVAPGQHLKDAIDEAGDVLDAAARTEGGR